MELIHIEGTKSTFKIQLSDQELKKEKWKLCCKSSMYTYYVSNMGRAKREDKILNLTINQKSGYGACGNLKNIHRHIGKAFLPDYNDKLQINHINGIKHDNRVSNLEAVTNKQNMAHAATTGLLGQTKYIYVFNRYGEFFDRFISIAEACRYFNLSPSTITNSIKNKTIQSFFIFSFDSEIDLDSYKTITYRNLPIAKLTYSGDLVEVYKNEQSAYESVGDGERNNGRIVRKMKTDRCCYGYQWIPYAEYKYNIENKISLSVKPSTNKSILQLDLNGNLIKRHDNTTSASKETGIGISNIRQVLSGYNKSAGGYIWVYE